MPHSITEDQENADFDIALSLPNDGETGTWWDVYEAGFQQLADRAQAARKLLGVVMAGGLATRKIQVPIAEANALSNSGSIFAYSFSSGAHYWQQTDVSSAGKVVFEVPQLPIGAKITGVYAWWANTNNTTLPVTTMPALTLEKNVYSAGAAADPGSYNSTVATASDATAVSATYKLLHKVAITGLSETVAEDVVYRVGFSGEDGTNEQTGGNLAGIWIELSV